MFLSGPRAAAIAGQTQEFPGRRKRSDRDLDHGRAVAALEGAGERGGELGGGMGTLCGGPEALRESYEVRIGEIAGGEAGCPAPPPGGPPTSPNPPPPTPTGPQGT